MSLERNKAVFKNLHKLSTLSKKINAPISLAHALGLDLERLTDEKCNIMGNGSLTIRNKILTYQCKVPTMEMSKEHYIQNRFFPLSGFLAMVDEFTTWDVVLNDRKGRFGVSTSLEIEVGPDFYNNTLKPGDIVELRSRYRENINTIM